MYGCIRCREVSSRKISEISSNKKNMKILIAGIQSQPMHLMKTIGILGELVPKERVFDTLSDSKAFIVNGEE